MAAGQRVVSREDVPVRRTERESGTVSYDWEHQGRPIRVMFRADRTVRVHFPEHPMRLDRLEHSPQGWANIDLTPAT